MPTKKGEIPTNLSEEEPGAIQKLTEGRGTQSGASSSSPVTPVPEPVEKVRSQGKTRNVKPTSFYLTDKQLRKLDHLAYTYNGRTGKRINRNDIIRYLVDTCDIGSLHDL